MFKFIRYLLIFSLVFSQSIFAKDNQMISNAINLYVGKGGQDYFANNLVDIIDANGYDPTYYRIQRKTITTKEALLEDLVANEELKETIAKIKEVFKKYLVGLNFGKHKFSVNLDVFEVMTDWNQLGVVFSKPSLNEFKDDKGVHFNLVLSTDFIEVKIEKTKLEDVNHKFLGHIGIKDLFLNFSENSEPLFLKFPIRIYKDEQGKFKAEAGKPVSNLDEVLLDAQYSSPLELPRIEIRINDHVITPNLEEIESLFMTNLPKLTDAGQREVHNWIINESAEKLTKVFNKVLEKGLMEENVMDPPGAPKGKEVVKYKWGLDITDAVYVGDSVGVYMNAYVNDPTGGNLVFQPSMTSLTPPRLDIPKVDDTDLTLAINQGLFNRILQLSTKRGYFKNLEYAKGQYIKLVGQPVVNLKEGGSKEGHLRLTVAETVTGWKKVFVKNPLHVTFDLKIGFVMKDGKVQMVAKKIDESSIHLPKSNVRAFYKKVYKTVVSTIQEKQPAIAGAVLADELPVPESLGGIQTKLSGAGVDKNGYIMIYMDIVR